MKKKLTLMCLAFFTLLSGVVLAQNLKRAAQEGTDETVVFDIAANPWGHALGSGSGETADAGNITEPIVEQGVVLSFDKGEGTVNPRFWTGPQIRVYKANTFTLTAPEGKAIKKIVLASNNTSYTSNPVGLTDKTWEGNSTSVVFSVSATVQLTKIEVTIADADSETTAPVSIANTKETAYSVAKAIELIDAGVALSDVVFVKGIISKVDKFDETNKYINYWISDDGTETGGQLEAYKGKGLNGADFTAITDVEVGATVIITGTLTKYNDTYEFNAGNYLVSYPVPAEDITISPENGADIAAALTAAAEGKNVGNITINLAEGGAYSISASIVAPASLTINGNGATIDASALTAAMVTTPAGDLAEWMEGNFTISGVKITGLQKGVYASAGKNYLYNDFKIENSVIELAGTGGCEFDFRKGGVAKNFTIDKSTIYAPIATGNSLYTSQSAQKATEAPGVEVQTFAITNSTLYNLAKGKNFFTHRQANQKWLAYTLTNSLFVNCGKSGQVVKGVNQGQNGANPTWSINGNAFNFEDGEGGFKDTSADESTGDEAEPVQNSVAGVMAFTSLEAPDFGGVFKLGEGAAAPESLGDPRWTITYKVMPTNIEISPENGADIAAALTTATEGKNVGDITINLAEGGAYSISASIVAPASLTINGNGATIDASALTAAMVTTPAGDLAEWMEGNFTISGVKITGLQKGVYASAGKNYLYNDFKIENSVIELAGTGGCEFDFRKGGVAKNFTIDKSTIYAPIATGNSLYTSQSAQKATEAPGVEVQTFAITNSTLYNLAKGKNFFTHRQANQKWLAYTLTNSLFVNCGKSGQVVKGVNQGQNGANPTWSINGNAFNFEDGEGGFKDTSAEESTGDEAEPVQNSVAGVMAFTSLETPDFGGVFTLGEGATAPESLGDPRWTINYEKDAPAKLYLITGNWDRTNMIDVPFNNETQAYEYETAPEDKMWFAFADKQLTAEEAEADPNWTDFNTNHRYAIGAGDVDASLNEALPLLKIEGTLVLEPVPAGKVYKISVAKDWSTVTITVEVPTGIQSISADKFAEGEWYTIQGVRVEKPAKGIFIHNGRKVVVK